MSDKLSHRLHLLGKAADPARYRLLCHAADHGVVRSQEAPDIAELDPTTGTAGYHLQELVNENLMRRSRHGEYRLTPEGSRAARSLRAYAEGRSSSPGTKQVIVMAFVDESVAAELSDVVPPSGALIALLETELKAGHLRSAGALEVSRVLPEDDEESIRR